MPKNILVILLLFSIKLAHSQDVTLNIRVLIEGYYRGSGTMVAVADPLGYPHVCDTIKVNLLDTARPGHHVLYSTSSVISTTGYGSFIFPPSVLNGTYFIQMVHRNALTVFSRSAVFFSCTSSFYDFTTLPLPPCKGEVDSGDGFALMYSGDLDQNGFIEITDIPILTTEIESPFPYGYLVSDLNGDRYADLLDIPILVTNIERNLWSFFYDSCASRVVNKICNYPVEVNIYPNPSTDHITLHYNWQDKKNMLQIFNALGELVVTNETEASSTSKTISVVTLPDGIYVIRTTIDGNTLTKRIVVQR